MRSPAPIPDILSTVYSGYTIPPLLASLPLLALTVAEMSYYFSIDRYSLLGCIYFNCAIVRMYGYVRKFLVLPEGMSGQAFENLLAKTPASRCTAEVICGILHHRGTKNLSVPFSPPERNRLTMKIWKRNLWRKYYCIKKSYWHKDQPPKKTIMHPPPLRNVADIVPLHKI